MKRSYSDDFIANALATFEANGGVTTPGALTRTAKEVGVPHPTMSYWVKTLDAKKPVQHTAPIQHDFVAIWAESMVKTLEVIDAKRPQASFRDLSIFAGIAADKHLDYRDGRRGTEINVDNRRITIVRETDWRRGLDSPEQVLLPEPKEE